MSDNERGFHHPHAIDKGIQRGLHDINSVGCPDMPGGITSMTPLNADPHGRSFKSPIADAPSSRRPVGEPTEMKPPHDPDPHPPTPAAQKQLPNTYARPRFER
jgi:hypothetical protein